MRVRVFGTDAAGAEIALYRLLFAVATEPATAQVMIDPRQLTSLPGTTGGELSIAVSLQEPVDTTVVLSAANLPPDADITPLVFQITADTAPPSGPLDIDGDGLVTETDIILALRWLAAGRPAVPDNALLINLGLTDLADDSYMNLISLFGAVAHRSDIDDNGVSNHVDMRIILRWLSGLRGSALSDLQVNRVKLQLLLEQPESQ